MAGRHIYKPTPPSANSSYFPAAKPRTGRPSRLLGWEPSNPSPAAEPDGLPVRAGAQGPKCAASRLHPRGVVDARLRSHSAFSIPMAGLLR